MVDLSRGTRIGGLVMSDSQHFHRYLWVSATRWHEVAALEICTDLPMGFLLNPPWWCQPKVAQGPVTNKANSQQGSANHSNMDHNHSPSHLETRHL